MNPDDKSKVNSLISDLNGLMLADMAAMKPTVMAGRSFLTAHVGHVTLPLPKSFFERAYNRQRGKTHG